MIRTLVSVDTDLASVIAINYASRLSQVFNMGIQPIHVKEPEPGAKAPGVGWVRSTWENSLLSREEEGVERIIRNVQGSRSAVGKPQIRTGRRDDEILSDLIEGRYDLFVEGCVSSFEKSTFLKRIRSRLYRLLPCPVVIAKNLVEIRKSLVLLCAGIDIQRLIPELVGLFNGAMMRFDLLYCRFTGPKQTVAPIESEHPMLEEAGALLLEHGWTPEKRFSLQGPPDGLAKHTSTYSLLATGLSHQPEKSDPLLELLGKTDAPVLVCWQ